MRKAGIPPQVASNPDNARVLDFLSSLSAHSDVAELLLGSVGQLGDVEVICPNPSEYRYVAVATRGVVFGFASGMDTVAFRVPPSHFEIALKTGGEAAPMIGEDWALFEVFRSEWPTPDLTFWATKAYVEARK